MTQQPHLDPHEEDAWQQLLALVEYLPGLIDHQLQQTAGIGRFDYAVLVMLARAEGHTLSMLDLSAVTFGSLSRLSHTITRLVGRGLVTRRRVGRCRLVTLTDAGWRMAVAASPGHVAELRTLIFDHLPAERVGELGDLLRPVAEHLKAIAPRS